MPKRLAQALNGSVSTTSPTLQPSASKPILTGIEIAAVALRGIKTLLRKEGEHR
jgi:hypothetical protein